MQVLTRRSVGALSLGGLSLGALSMVAGPRVALADGACVAGQQVPLPNRLSVDCASRQNFQSFRKYPTYFGLAGIVSMTAVTGKSGTIAAGSLMLFPWLKPKAMAAKGAVFKAAYPTGHATSASVRPVPGGSVPPDEYFCHVVLRAPSQSFIGFMVDQPMSTDMTRLDWCSNIPRLADGEGVGVDWTSSNLNGPWFGGSRVIPASSTCNGDIWRALIADGLNQASVGAC